jgi:hypothetical protein
VPDLAIELDRPDELVREWCLGRYLDAATGIIYHPSFNPPPPVSGRQPERAGGITGVDIQVTLIFGAIPCIAKLA